jgi:hypothetical protein
MTEADWLICNDPQKMLIYLACPPAHRKMLLFAIACCKRVVALLVDERSHKALEKLERFAEGQCGPAELDEGSKLAYEAIRSIGQPQLELERRRRGGIPWADLKDEADRLQRLDNAAWAVYAALMGAKYESLPVPYSYGPLSLMKRCRAALRDEADAVRQYQANVLRDIFGNPFSPVVLEHSWLTPNVVALAQEIYDSQAFDRLSLLADELEEAGCHNSGILDHCRQPGLHAPGCWLLDLLMGKE